jgi:hypothetical protein
MPLSSMLKMFPGVSGSLFSVATFSSILKMFQQCSGSFFELELKKDVQQSYPAPSGSLWKLFANSHVSSKPNCSGTNSICGVKPAAQDV